MVKVATLESMVVLSSDYYKGQAITRDIYFEQLAELGRPLYNGRHVNELTK